MQGIEHGTTGKMVKGTNGVNGEDRGSEARLRRGGTEQCGAKCCASTRPTLVAVERHITSPTTSVRTRPLGFRSDEASDPETFKHNGGGCCIGEPAGGAMQQARVLLVVQENAEMLIGRAGGASGRALSGGPEAVKERLLGEKGQGVEVELTDIDERGARRPRSGRDAPDMLAG
eukprot:s3209_g9.t1